jgi:pantoate--beta-alanine ligase
VREPDGLALSSRNVYLSAEQRRIAPNLARVLRSVVAALAQDPSAVGREIARGSAALKQVDFEIDYLEIRERDTLTRVTTSVAARSRVFAAVRLGNTRLIDNMPIN